jgi:hypothetical protein
VRNHAAVAVIRTPRAQRSLRRYFDAHCQHSQAHVVHGGLRQPLAALARACSTSDGEEIYADFGLQPL